MWQLLLKSLLREKLQAVVMDQAAQAMRAQQEGAAAEGTSDACLVGVVAATTAECGSIEDKLTDFSRVVGDGITYGAGALGQAVVALARSGAGEQAASQATLGLIQGHRPAWILSAGFSGALQPELAQHDLVLGSQHAAENGQTVAVASVAGWTPPTAAGAAVHVGTLLTAERAAHSPAEKRELGERTGALAVDTESFAVAATCAQWKIPFLAVRIVFDAVDETRPRRPASASPQAPAARRWGSALGALVNRPSSAVDMLRQKERELVAADRLAEYLAAIIGCLPAASAD